MAYTDGAPNFVFCVAMPYKTVSDYVMMDDAEDAERGEASSAYSPLNDTHSELNLVRATRPDYLKPPRRTEDPTGESGHGPGHLLRAICIMSMTPTRLLAPHPHIFEARRRAYELDVYTGGSCFNTDRARSFLGLLEEGRISIWPNRELLWPLAQCNAPSQPVCRLSRQPACPPRRWSQRRSLRQPELP